MYTFLRTEEFDEWLERLRDDVGKARILARIRSAEAATLAIPNLSAAESRKCGSTLAPVTGCTIAAAKRSCNIF